MAGKPVHLAIPMFGYKNHIGIDKAHGLIRTWAASAANAHDGARPPVPISKDNTASVVWADVAAIRATNKELADAAYAEPFDKNRMVLAMRARAQAQAQAQADSMAHYPDNGIAILEQLPKADQVIFARSNSGAMPMFPPKSCL